MRFPGLTVPSVSTPTIPSASSIALAFLLALPNSAEAQDVRGAGFRADPNLVEPVQAIAQGPDGRVWLATLEGLLIYDGYDLNPFVGGPGSTRAFPRGAVRTLFVDSRQRLWVGHGVGLVLVDPIEDVVEDIWVHETGDPSSLTAGEVTSIQEDRQGRIWVGTLSWMDENAGGLNLLDESREGFVRFRHDPDDPSSLSHNRVRTILEDSRGNLWVGTWAGLSRRPAGENSFVRYLHDPSDPASLVYDDVMSLHEDAAGTLWVGTIGGGLDRYDPSRDGFEHIRNPGSDFLMSIVEDPGGDLWIGTLDGGLLALERGTEALREVDLGPEAGAVGAVSALAITRDHVLWVAGYSSEFGAGRVLRLDLEAPPLNVEYTRPVSAVAEGRDGTLWIGSGNRLYARTQGEERLRSYECPGLGSPTTQQWLSTIVEAPDGTLWLGYWDPDLGICRLDPGSETPVPVRPKQPSDPELNWIFDMSWWQGRLWISAAANLVALDPATGRVELVDEPVPDPETLAREGIAALAVDDRGDLWYATRDTQLRRIRRGEAGPERFDASLSPAPGQPIRLSDLTASGDGRVWVATVDHGACEFEPDRRHCARRIERVGRRASSAIAAILPDDRDRLWLSVSSAIVEMRRDGTEQRELPLPPRVRDGRFQSASAVGRDGTLHFGSSVGVVSFHPDLASGNPRPPETRITRVETVGGGDLDLAAGRTEAGKRLELPGERSDVVFQYVGLHYVDPAQNRYAYRLDGVDEEWNDVGSERRARYTNLRPADYTFRVRSASANGVWSDQATFSFRILPPWWRQSWAVGIWVSLLLAGAVSIGVVMKRRRAIAATIERHDREAARLRELSETRSRLFANLSHEYRTPLTLILGEIESARGAVDGPATDRLENAERQTRELQRLTDELLELSRLESGAVVLDRRPGDLVELVRDAVASFRSAAESDGIELRFREPGLPVRARFDPDRLRRVVNNLLSNALKFTSRGGEVRVAVDLVSAPGSPDSVHADESPKAEHVARIVVEDDGTGIPSEATSRIFDRFFRVPDVRAAATGTGIGLSLVRELVELHEGTIGVESEVGRGTRFEVRIPLDGSSDRVAGSDDVDEVGPDDSGASEHESDDPVILVVDDHADMRAFLVRELEADHRVVEAAAGGEALAKAIEVVPDLVITDVAMPGMDGYELVRQLRRDERTSHVPIIMLTGRASEEARITGLESGVDEYLTKPFSARVLRSRVENLLELRRLLRELLAGDVWLKPAEVDAPSIDQKFLDRVSRTIEGRMSDSSFTVEELARSVSMSRSQLHRKLTALLGQSPGALIRHMRLRRSADLIRSGSRTLSQIAYDTGFSDQAHFSRSFKKQFGCPPSEFKARSTDSGFAEGTSAEE